MQDGNSATVDTTVEGYCADVTCISVNNNVNSSFLVLVGRADGTLDLFIAHEYSPIQTWNVALFSDARDSKAAGGDVSVTYVHWLPQRVACFIVIDSNGCCSYFDLSKNAQDPLYRDELDVKGVTSLGVDLSDCRSGSATSYLAVASVTREGGHDIRVRKLFSGFFNRLQTLQLLVKEEEELKVSMDSWCARSVVPNIKQVLKANSDKK